MTLGIDNLNRMCNLQNIKEIIAKLNYIKIKNLFYEKLRE